MTINKKLVVSASGIFICFFYHGILQEKITRSTYGKNDKFTFVFTLVFVTCVINVIFAKIMLHTFMKHGEDSTRQLYYAATGFCYLSAMVSTNMALRHVNYPTQVLGKSCKPIPVMILGVLIGKKKYPLAKYAYVFMIVFGVCLFMYKDKPAVAENEDAAIIGMGEILLLISLTLDGFIGAIQDRMKTEYQSKPAHMMYYINLWSTLVLGIVVLLTGEIWSFVPFVEKYPFIIYNLLGFSIMCALGQVAIAQSLWSFLDRTCDRRNAVQKLVYENRSGQASRSRKPLLSFHSYNLSVLQQAMFAVISFEFYIGLLYSVFIFLVVSEFGPLLCSIITTTRKFFTLLTSVFLFGNPLTTQQWLGTFLVFMGLTLDGVFGRTSKQIYLGSRDIL